jgi:hypothetical protein
MIGAAQIAESYYQPVASTPQIPIRRLIATWPGGTPIAEACLCVSFCPTAGAVFRLDLKFADKLRVILPTRFFRL